MRKLEITKVRGRAALPGRHTFRISSQGVQVFPRAPARIERSERFVRGERAATGIPGMDGLIGGGFPAGDATLVCGPSGSGTTVFATHFVAEGNRSGESCVLAVFEEYPDEYLERARSLGFELRSMVEAGKLEIISLRPIDLSVDEILHQIQQAVTRLGATRVVIDSLNGLELSLAQTQREDFRESMYRMVGRLTGGGVSVLLTIEVTESFSEIKFSPHAISFLAQNLVFLRYEPDRRHSAQRPYGHQDAP